VRKDKFCINQSLFFVLLSFRLAYITTLDGHITALDLTNKGEVKWSIPTGPDPLISSSIHTLELTNNGKMVRMIPSLNGGLYKFDGDSIEAIPITADDLLRSSFKIADDYIIAGGKETSIYGVSIRTGQILYEHSMRNNENRTNVQNELNQNRKKTAARPETDLPEHDPLLDDVLVVRRQTQTVRAVEPHGGNERWNFSVGYHELQMSRSKNCHPIAVDDLLSQALLDIELKVIVPEGIICAFSKQTPGVILWQHKFNYPIVSAWRMDGSGNSLENVDLFSGTDWLWQQNPDAFLGQHDHSDIAPSLYLGMFEKQIYIQESVALQKVYKDRQQLTTVLQTDTSNHLRIPWKPFPATSKAWALMETQKSDLATIETDNGEEIFESSGAGADEPSKATAIAVLYASEYINGNGFYLFSAKDFNKTHQSGLCNQQKFYNTDSSVVLDGQDIVDDDDYEFMDDIPVKIIIMSLWYWWKEILVISLTTGLLMNFILNNHRLKGMTREVVVVERHIEVPVPMAKEAVEDDEVFMQNRTRGSQRSLSESNHSENGFTSRFLNDFDLVQCLGKGGFGVVFEVSAADAYFPCTWLIIY
jgi:eukaryotic translation initiation factor 2-alpha kinase 3